MDRTLPQDYHSPSTTLEGRFATVDGLTFPNFSAEQIGGRDDPCVARTAGDRPNPEVGRVNMRYIMNAAYSRTRRILWADVSGCCSRRGAGAQRGGDLLAEFLKLVRSDVTDSPEVETSF